MFLMSLKKDQTEECFTNFKKIERKKDTLHRRLRQLFSDPSHLQIQFFDYNINLESYFN